MLPAPSSTRSARARKSSSAASRSNRSTSTTASRTRSPSRSSARPASCCTPATSRSTTRRFRATPSPTFPPLPSTAAAACWRCWPIPPTASAPASPPPSRRWPKACAACLPAPKNRRIIVATFASNIYRVQQIIELAMESGRKVAVSGRSMVSNTEMARELGYIRVPDNVLIDVEEGQQIPARKGRADHDRQPGRTAVRAVAHGAVQPPQRQGRPVRLHHHLGAAHPRQRKDRDQGRQRPAQPRGRRSSTRTCTIPTSPATPCQEEQKLILTLAHPAVFPARARRVQAAQTPRRNGRAPGLYPEKQHLYRRKRPEHPRLAGRPRAGRHGALRRCDGGRLRRRRCGQRRSA